MESLGITGKMDQTPLSLYLKNKGHCRQLTHCAVMISLFMIGGCSNGPSENDIAEAINKEIAGEKTCYSLQNNNITSWPLRVQGRESTIMFSRDLVLAAMQSAGYLKVTHETQKRRGFLRQPIDVIMPTEEAKKWWDLKDGFCVGSMKVFKVEEWTEPSEKSGMPIQVKYTWKLVTNSWAEKDEFNKIKGIGEPVQATAIIQKTNKGWKASAL